MAESPQSKPDEDILQNSTLYQEFLAEREEILRHKWLESEKQHRDIGFERALLDWIRNHRDDWRAKRRQRPGETSPGTGPTTPEATGENRS